MNFDPSPEHELVRSTVRGFAEERIGPLASELDGESRFPYELVAELAELGLMGMPIPEEYGRRRHRYGRLRDRDRGAGAGRLVRRDHCRRAHLARDDANLPVRE